MCLHLSEFLASAVSGALFVQLWRKVKLKEGLVNESDVHQFSSVQSFHILKFSCIQSYSSKDQL